MSRHSTTRNMRPQKSRDQLGESILCDFFDKISENLTFLSGTSRYTFMLYIILILVTQVNLFMYPLELIVAARYEKMALKVTLHG